MQLTFPFSRSKKELERVNAELKIKNAEMQLQQEKLTAINEELRAANDEIKTINEKLLITTFEVSNAEDIIYTLAQAIEAKDDYTKGHSERVGDYAQCIAQSIGLPDEEKEIIYRAALLHDIGKIGISDNILNKKGTLEQKEFVIIRQHPDTAVRILSNLKFVQKYIPYIKYHHEWYNGNGYPEGLSGEEIPIGAKILAVADAFDAMTSDRPYRKGMSVDAALEILDSGSGTQWDAKMVQALMYCKQTFSHL